MGHYYGAGPGAGGLVWLLLGLFWIALVAVIAFLAIRLLTSSRGDRLMSGADPQESPEQILDRLFAVGEIDEATYRARRTAMHEMRDQ